jgi:hypothetical protein
MVAGEFMSQRDGFSTGFFLGSLIGGLVGGALGVVLTSRQIHDEEPEVLRRIKARTARNRTEEGESRTMESARQSLENKIAELNGAIDDVRSSLSAVSVEPVAQPEPLEHRDISNL